MVEKHPQWHALPGRRVAPALDALVLGDLMLGREASQLGEGERERILNQPTDLEPPVYEPPLNEVDVCMVARGPPVGSRVRRDVLRSVALSRRQRLEQPRLHRVDEALQGVLNDARLPK